MKIRIILEQTEINKENKLENGITAVDLFDAFYRFTLNELGLSFYQIEQILLLMIEQNRLEIIKASHKNN